jgi:hypothetical protein
VFFWLLLHNRLNTRAMLRRKNMELDSYTCGNCILQKEETVTHLFLRCNFARRCWQTIGLAPPKTSDIHNVMRLTFQQLDKNWKVEAVMVMLWCIWKCRNGWLFENVPPTVQGARRCSEKRCFLSVT